MSAWVIAIPNAAATVIPNEVRPPTSATLSAGTISNVIVTGSTDFWLPATRMPSRPEITVDSTQLVPARKSGENPSSIAPFSFSAAARVAMPNRVKRNRAHSASVERDHDRDHEELLGVHADRERQLHLLRCAVAEQRRAGGGAEAAHDDRLEEQQHPDRRDDLRERRRVAQRPEHEEVQREAHEHAEHQRHGQRRRERERSAEGDLRRPARAGGSRYCRRSRCTTPSTSASGFGSGGRNRTPVGAQPGVDVRRVHRGGAGREVRRRPNLGRSAPRRARSPRSTRPA